MAAAERDEAARAAWRAALSGLAPVRFVFVDETGNHRGMTPQSARAPRGERAHGRVTARRGTNLTLIAALSLRGMGAAMTLEGAGDGAVGEA